uniref:DUF4974 domain-containing protein n=1 Tax=Roseihalotalea indica TaxID=2867963 RepID=A0AA49JG01_9BACT|nr:DUF4974 domain-containing protein [Tunicatimonas sp. TK19036]
MAPYLNLINKKLSAEISEEEELVLQKWLDSSPRNQRLFRELSEAWHSAYKPSVQGQDETFEKLSARLALDQKPPASVVKSQAGRFWLHGWKVAASLLLLLGAAIVFFVYSEDAAYVAPSETIVEATVTKSNPRGQKSIITLPDGSEVRLNAESHLEYNKDFSKNRQIKLVGEAFFNVVRDTLHPFTVTAGEVEVRVLGTSFNVQAFPFEEDLTVAVASGAVRVEKKNQGHENQTSQLHPQEMVKVNRKTGSFEKGTFETDELMAWKDGILVFQQASFEQIVHKLERWYGVDFIIRRKSPITNGFTGRYRNPSLELVLEGMSFSSGFNFTIEGKQVIIE